MGGISPVAGSATDFVLEHIWSEGSANIDVNELPFFCSLSR
jgi:hypothetical protein